MLRNKKQNKLLALEHSFVHCIILKPFIDYNPLSVFSSPEPNSPAELIGFEVSAVRRRPSTISNEFSSEFTGSFVTKFHTSPPDVGGTKSCSNRLGYITNIAVRPIFGKKLNYLLLKNQYTDNIETLYVALCTRVLSRLFKLWAEPD